MNATAKSVAKTAAIPFLKKITPKTVTEAVGFNLLTQNRPVPPRHLYDLFGVVSGVKQKADEKNEKGVWTQFKGQFRAVLPPDPETGEILQFESGAAHIPMLEDMIFSAFQSAKANDDRAQVHIALRIAIVTAPDTKPSMTGYEFNVQRLIPAEDQAEDPIVRLMRASAEANKPAQITQDKPAAGTASTQAATAAAAAPDAKAPHHKGAQGK